MDPTERFEADLHALGFALVQQKGSGVAQFSRAETAYLTYWVHWDVVAETVLFTWELGIGELMSSLGLQIGSHDELNEYLYPRHDAQGAQDIAFVVDEIDRVEKILRAVDLLADRV